ncbi:MAG: SDR family oxidoreductase [Nitrospirae bacterium]|nr:SDR family oxidoreductase [Nitrospirota bacterium]
MSRLAGKIAVVTGSSSGIGKAIALTFAREGATVVIAARRTVLCQQVAEQIRRLGGTALAIPTDVTDEGQVDHLMAETVRRYGRLDLLMNNAGIVAGGRLAELSTTVFDQVMNTNLRGTFLCCRAGFQQMKQTGGGTILNMSSVAGVQAWAGTGVYSASKFGIMALTKALADEGRPHAIKVMVICPGGVADELVDASQEEIVRSGKISPYDVAETAVYLATLGPNTIVHQVIVDRMGAEW